MTIPLGVKEHLNFIHYDYASISVATTTRSPVRQLGIYPIPLLRRSTPLRPSFLGGFHVLRSCREKLLDMGGFQGNFSHGY
jgi:hypothetical protein